MGQEPGWRGLVDQWLEGDGIKLSDRGLRTMLVERAIGRGLPDTGLWILLTLLDLTLTAVWRLGNDMITLVFEESFPRLRCGWTLF